MHVHTGIMKSHDMDPVIFRIPVYGNLHLIDSIKIHPVCLAALTKTQEGVA